MHWGYHEVTRGRALAKNFSMYQRLCIFQVMKELRNTLPVVFDLVVALGGYEDCITPILREMATRADSPFSTTPAAPDPIIYSVSESSELKSLSYFPTMPIVRRRRIYECDSAKNSKLSIIMHKKAYWSSVLDSRSVHSVLSSWYVRVQWRPSLTFVLLVCAR